MEENSIFRGLPPERGMKAWLTKKLNNFGFVLESFAFCYWRTPYDDWSFGVSYYLSLFLSGDVACQVFQYLGDAPSRAQSQLSVAPWMIRGVTGDDENFFVVLDNRVAVISKSTRQMESLPLPHLGCEQILCSNGNLYTANGNRLDVWSTTGELCSYFPIRARSVARWEDFMCVWDGKKLWSWDMKTLRGHLTNSRILDHDPLAGRVFLTADETSTFVADRRGVAVFDHGDRTSRERLNDPWWRGCTGICADSEYLYLADCRGIKIWKRSFGFESCWQHLPLPYVPTSLYRDSTRLYASSGDTIYVFETPNVLKSTQLPHLTQGKIGATLFYLELLRRQWKLPFSLSVVICFSTYTAFVLSLFSICSPLVFSAVMLSPFAIALLIPVCWAVRPLNSLTQTQISLQDKTKPD